MASFKEMLEAKKKAAAAQLEPTVFPIATPTKEQAIEQQIAAQEITLKEVAKEVIAVTETVIAQPEKKKSFAEIMAEKNAAKQVESAKQGEAPKAVAPVESAISGASQLVVSLVKEDTGTLKAETAPIESPANANADLATSQAYADIKSKIEQLEELEDTVLSGAMSELKKALMQNPNAVSLMLDTDIGKMVIALRRITKEAQIENAKEKTKGRPAKASKLLPLSAEALEAVFDEL